MLRRQIALAALLLLRCLGMPRLATGWSAKSGPMRRLQRL